MKSNILIVEGGGWIARKSTGRPRTRFFGFAAVIWLAVSLCAAPVFMGRGLSSWGYLEFLGIAVLVAQGVLIILTTLFFLLERPRTRTELQRDPGHDVRKLY